MVRIERYWGGMKLFPHNYEHVFIILFKSSGDLMRRHEEVENVLGWVKCSKCMEKEREGEK